MTWSENFPFSNLSNIEVDHDHDHDLGQDQAGVEAEVEVIIDSKILNRRTKVDLIIGIIEEDIQEVVVILEVSDGSGTQTLGFGFGKCLGEYHSGPEKLKKVQAKKKLVKSNKSIPFFAISKIAKNQFLN